MNNDLRKVKVSGTKLRILDLMIKSVFQMSVNWYMWPSRPTFLASKRPKWRRYPPKWKTLWRGLGLAIQLSRSARYLALTPPFCLATFVPGPVTLTLPGHFRPPFRAGSRTRRELPGPKRGLASLPCRNRCSMLSTHFGHQSSSMTYTSIGHLPNSTKNYLVSI